MITKIRNLWSHPASSGAKALHGILGHDKFDAFYTGLDIQIHALENQLGQESHFSLAWILAAMEFVRSLHSSVCTLIEELWLPSRKTVGIDVVETYFDVSVKLLEMCNYLRDGVSELEYSQLSLEQCLQLLGGLVGNSVPAEEGSDEFVAAKKQLESCRLELEKMESKTAPNLWLEMKCKSMRTSGKSNSRGMGKQQAEQELSPIERSHSDLPSPARSKKSFLTEQVMVDTQLVTTFVSNLLLWVLTDTSEEFSFSPDLNGPSFAPGVVDGWSAALLSLRDRIETSALKHKKSNCAMSLKEIRVVHDAVRDLTEQVETAMQQRAEVPGTDHSELLTAALEQSRDKLHHMTQVSDKLSVVTQDIFSEILHCQEKIMKVVENQLMRSVTI